jgi:hypothetical protein
MKPAAPKNRLIADDELDAVEREAQVARPASDAKPFAEGYAPRTPRRRAGKGAYPGRRQVTGYVEDKLFLWLKSISAQHDKTMVEIFEEALTAYVNSYAAQRKFGGSP